MYSSDSRFKPALYDVEIYIDAAPVHRGRSVALRRRRRSERFVEPHVLTGYLFKKLHSMQLIDDLAREPNKDNVLKINNVMISLSLLQNFLDVEIDYHLGDRVCMRPENIGYLNTYVNSTYCGYGPQYCDDFRLSRLARYYGRAAPA